MRKLISAIFITMPALLVAQIPEDALRYSGYSFMGGTARNQAIGGGGGALGGDITSAHYNPAGIGLYRNKEMVLSPNFSFLNNNYDYRGEAFAQSKSKMGYGTSGFVFGKNDAYRQNRSSSFSLSVNQTANFNNQFSYKGLNTQSSWSEQYIEQLVRDRATEVQAGENYIFGSSLAFNTYLVDTMLNAGGQLNGYQSLVPISPGGVNQQNHIVTRGAAHEIAFAFANNINNTLHLGLGIGLPIYGYEKNQTYREDDATDNPNNSFKYFEYTENYRTNGIGINAKLGVIYRPQQSNLRLGLSIHTPTFASFTDRISSELTTHTESYTALSQPRVQSSEDLKGDNPDLGTYQYSLRTPFKLLASAAYVLGQVNEVKEQKGFLTADLELVNYKGARYAAADETIIDDVNYYNELNKTIKERYRTTINMRVGGEVKFNTFMARAGFAYLGSPYKKQADKDNQLQGNRMLVSGGVGYRNRGFFVDLTYVHAMLKESHVPYYLSDKASPVADGKNTRGNIVLTFGVKI